MKNLFAVRSAMKFACLFACMSVALAACGETWILKASNGYYVLAWNDMQYWQSVEGGTNGVAGVKPSESDVFLVISNRILRTGYTADLSPKNTFTFGGYSLQIGDSSTGGTLTVDPVYATFPRGGLILKRGNLLSNYARNNKYYIRGLVTVQSPATAPVFICSQQASYSNNTLVVEASLCGEEGTGMRIGGGTAAIQPPNTTFQFTEPSGYKGSVVIENSLHPNKGKEWGCLVTFGTMNTPGSITVESGGCLAAETNNAVVSAADISFASGSRLFVENRGFIKATNSLEVAAGAELFLRNSFPALPGDPDGGMLRIPVLQGPLDCSLTESSFTVVKTDECRNKDMSFEVETDASAGTKTLYINLRSIVFQTQYFSNEGSMNKGSGGTAYYASSLTNKTHWSDGELPHAGPDYLTSISLRTPIKGSTGYPGNTYDFPGASLSIMKGGSFTMFVQSVTIPRLFLGDGSLIRTGQQTGNVTLSVTGGVEIAGRARISAYSSQILTILDEISGYGEMLCNGVDSTGAPEGYYAFTGMNTNYLGTICVSQAVNNAAYAPRLHLYDGRNLGGRLPSFNPRALRLDDAATLYVPSKNTTVTLSDGYNRGLAISCSGGMWPLNAGTVLEIEWPILLDGTMLVKGAGRTVLGGEMTFAAADGSVSATPCANSNLVSIAANATLVAAHSGCLDGCCMTFGSGSKLVLRADPSNADLTRYGIKLTKTGTALNLDSSFGGVLPLTVETSAEVPADPVTIGIVTVPTGSELATAVLGTLPSSFTKIWPGTRQTLVSVVDAETGLTTIGLKVSNDGTTLYVR